MKRFDGFQFLEKSRFVHPSTFALIVCEGKRVSDLQGSPRRVAASILNGKDYVVIVQIKQQDGNATVIVTSHTPER